MRRDQVDLSNAVVWIPDSKLRTASPRFPSLLWQLKPCGAFKTGYCFG